MQKSTRAPRRRTRSWALRSSPRPAAATTTTAAPTPRLQPAPKPPPRPTATDTTEAPGATDAPADDATAAGEHGGRPRGHEGHHAARRAAAGLQGPLCDRRRRRRPHRLQLRRRDLRRRSSSSPWRPSRRRHRRHRLRRARSTASRADGEKCTDYATCKTIIDAGGDLDYDGVSGPITLNGNGEPLEASYGVLTFGDDNRIDDSLTTYMHGQGAADADARRSRPVEGVAREGDGELKIGSILPADRHAGVPRATRVRRRRPGHPRHQRRRWRARQAGRVLAPATRVTTRRTRQPDGRPSARRERRRHHRRRRRRACRYVIDKITGAGVVAVQRRPTPS